MRRRLLPWIVAVGLVLGVTVGGVALANATAFSAVSFVRLYLSFLSAGDACAAAAMPGVQHGSGPRLEELTPGALGGVRIVHDVTEANGEHRILAGWTARGRSGQTTFVVEPTAAIAGVFPQWRFAASPTATLRVTVFGDPRFQVNGVGVTGPAIVRGRSSADYTVLIPGDYRLGADSRMLAADPHDTLLARADTTVDASVHPEPTAAFVAATNTAAHAALKACTTQHVLMPTGCDVGYDVTDRVSSTPLWSMVRYPTVHVLVPSSTPGVWDTAIMPSTAHLTVQITSLFDGSTSQLDRDVAFTASYAVTLDAQDRPVLTATAIPTG